MSLKRKSEHMVYAISSQNKNIKVFDDIHILYNSIPEVDFDDIDMSLRIFNRKFSFPLIINAITGGTEEGKSINEALANTAKEFNIPIAVGSQSVAVKDRNLRESFSIVRKVNKNGFILANVGANVSKDMAKEAVDMIEADALQLHLNVLQELIMPEGDRKFKGILNNIAEIKSKIHVPVIVKEVGFGMSGSAALKLIDAGIQTVDIGGYGGTNFARIESLRRNDNVGESLLNIGIPTAVSLIAVCKYRPELSVICGGGIRNGLDVIKALMMGADAASIAYPFLKAYKSKGEKGVFDELEKFIYEMKVSMISAGVKEISKLNSESIIITGKTLEWIKQLELK
ncbi:isopentenyl-diphosphate delta-isomerase [Oxobacter pfennigii]|uniref:Isopentenyl-diphosphate delta-isomerase n=1 Tax=Oxobacter pfennigii TaxID=36849 RepID=A0A0P8W662_9CLOT|nr:type 2 isopentenyl-diphosphate Delta-isomerase [Oxobacter pfennigii]KPU44180.1 isopentenyl-diphosphate delta-isomerase [Oxobacter pfennigii]